VITYTASVGGGESNGRMIRLYGKTRIYSGKMRIFSR
jgi:hypothetical protein